MTSPESNEQQRSEYRLTDVFTVYLETYAALEGDAQPSTLVITKTVDVSANGIQIVLDDTLPLHSVLQLCLENSEGEAPFILAGEVAWLRPQDTQTLTGFRILESDDTDVIRWKEYIAHCLLNE